MQRRRRLRGRSWNAPERFVPDASLPPLSNKVDYVPEKKSLVDEIREGEKKSTLAEIERKFSSSAPVCNKGAYMYIGASTDITALGRKK